MRRLLMLVVLSGYACASTYYVSSSTGNDSNSGTSPAAAWQTLTKVNGRTFAAGDRILLARGDVWWETLTPPSSGSNGNPIVFDAYGSGEAPEITGYQALSGWSPVTGDTNQWKVSLTASALNYVLFGSIWGTKQSSQSGLLHDRDYYLNGNTLYVFAPSDPSTYYGTMAAMVLTNTPLIWVNGKTYLTFQHIKLDWFDQYGVYVSGPADHLVFANMEADGMIPAGSLPLGFYVNATNPVDISFYNDSAHLNYDGFRVDGTASTIAVTNCSAYANRDSGVVDNTGGHVTYSYCHFYANGTGGIESLDVVGAVAGAGNLAADTTPNVQAFARYPARFSFTVDDVGLYAGSDTFVDALIPVFNARGLKMNAAIVAGATGVSYSTADVASWVAGGHEVDSHSWSHQYFTDPQYLSSNHIYNSANPAAATAFSLRYVGTGTAATATVSGGVLSTAVTGGPGGQNLNLNLATAPYDTLGGLTSYISSTYPGVYTVTTWTTPLMRTAAHSSTLANFSGQDIKTAAYGVQFDPTRAVTGLMADEATQSRAWLQSHIAGLTNVKVYVYPDGVTDPAFEAAVAAAGYEGARGTLSMCVSGAAPCSGSNAFVSYATGVNAQNITSLTPLAWTNYASLTQKQLDAKVAALIFKMRVWGYPVGLFVHANDYPDAGTAAMKTGWLLDSIAAHGGSVSRTDELIEAVLALQPMSGTTKYVGAADAAVDMRPTAGAAGVGKGLNKTATYGMDLVGTPRPAAGNWDLGAYQVLWTKHGVGSGAGHFKMGGASETALGENAYCGAGDVPAFGSTDGPASLPQRCVHTAMAGTPSPGVVHTASSCPDIQTQINEAAAGDTVVIPASLGKCVLPALTFPVKTGADTSHWTTIRTDQTTNPNFPPEGKQATPCEINQTSVYDYPNYPCASPGVRMPTISTTSTAHALDFTGASFYRVVGLNVTKEDGTSMGGCFVDFQSADHIVVDRSLIHGSSNLALDAHCGVSLRGTNVALVNSWVYDIDWNNPDGYAVSGGTGSQPDEGPVKLYNNLLAGASETWLFGGGGAAAWPHDYEIRRNLSMKPLKWMVPTGATTYNVSVNVKNLGEYKHGHRILYEDNIFMNDWEGQSDQYGSAVLLMPKNQTNFATAKRVNTSGTSVSCALDATGTPCGAGGGVWGNSITSLARTGGVLTIVGVNNGNNVGWYYYATGAHIVVQNLPSQVVNGVNLNTFNGEWVMGCSPTACTDGYGTPHVIYLNPADNPGFPTGADFPTTTTTGLVQDFTVQTCAVPGHCLFAAPLVNYPGVQIVSVTDLEHLTVAQDLGVQTGVTHKSCRPGVAPNAQVQDFTMRYNYVQHAENIGLTVANAVSECSDTTKGVSQVSIHDNVFDDIDTVAWTRGSGSCCGHGGTGPTLSNSFMNQEATPRDFTLAHNTFASNRGWPGVPHAASSFGFTDGFNYKYTGQTLQRVGNLVTITFSAISGESVTPKIIVAGFTGGYADLNGTWDVSQQLDTSLSFVESGTHADINPAISITSGTTGVGTLTPPPTYYPNIVFRDNIGPAPAVAGQWNGGLDSRGMAGLLNVNMCDPVSLQCTWTYKNNLLATADYAGYTQSAGGPYPLTNPDGSSACTLSGGCSVTSLSSVFTNWGNGLGDTSTNDYTVTAPYHNAASDGRDMGADIAHWKTVKAAFYPTFTFTPLTFSTASLSACTEGVYCEQQLLWAGGAGATANTTSFVQMHITNGTLPAGMQFSNNDATNACKVNGVVKNGPTGCVGWLWGTPTDSGNFPLTIQAEDAAHQQTSVNLTLTVN